MNGKQYNQLRRNKRPPLTLGVDDLAPRTRNSPHAAHASASPIGKILRTAARQLKDREAAQLAWERIARPEWLTGARVESVLGGVLQLAVANSSLRYELQRQKAALERHFRHFVPGLTALQFTQFDAAIGPRDQP